MNRIPPNNDPFYPDAYHEADHTPEGFCPTCESYTENYDHHGCCRECGTEVKENANL